ncbi:MAG: hypothetical protein EP319_13990 [Deltaproteobacteria bacterium]|nr:MAG: hypothetical protein EP319_13990 [Deltaproteobacteria bacterium]
MKRLWDFCRDIYNPGVHLYFATNWYFALYGAVAMNHQSEYTLSLSPLKVILSIFLILFYLRVIDEIKDFEYDKKFNPDRPLVKGSVTKTHLTWYLIGTIILTLILNLQLGISVLFFLILEFIYGFFLIILEKKNSIIRNNMMINLFFTYPVNILISVYIFLVFAVEQRVHFAKNIGWNRVDTYILFSFAACFLYYEFARKIEWPSKAQEGERLYSKILGFDTAVVFTVGLGLISMGLLYLSFNTVAIMLLIFPLAFGMFKIWKEKESNEKSSRPLTLSGTLFLGLYYGIIIVMSLLDFYKGFDFNRTIGP